MAIPGAPQPASIKPVDPEALRHLYDAERSNYWDAANLLSKSMAFYLAIAAATLAYALTQKLPPPLPSRIALGGLIVSLGYFVALAAGVYGLLRQMRVVEWLRTQLLTLGNIELQPSTAPRSWRNLVVVMAGATFLFLLVLLAGLVFLIPKL